MSDDGGFGGFKARIMAGWLKEAEEANAALAARVRELEVAQGELLGLLRDEEEGVVWCPRCGDALECIGCMA